MSKAEPGPEYAVTTRSNGERVLFGFYDFHRDAAGCSTACSTTSSG